MKKVLAAKLRHLANAGLPSGSFAVAILPLVRDLTSNQIAVLTWGGHDSARSTLVDQKLVSSSEIMASHSPEPRHEHKRETSTRFGTLRTANGVGAVPLTNIELRAAESMGSYNHLFAALRFGAEFIGRLSLFKRRNSLFTVKEIDNLSSQLPHIVGGLRQDLPLRWDDFTDLVHQELIVATSDGRLTSASEAARRLLRMASGASPEADEVVGDEAVLRRFLVSDGKIASIQDDAVVCNVWGVFRIATRRIYSESAGRQEIGIVITWLRSAVEGSIDRLSRLELSPRQQQVALLIEKGSSVPEIAASLSIKVNTASYHVQAIARKLSARNRRELAVKLRNELNNTEFPGCSDNS